MARKTFKIPISIANDGTPGTSDLISPNKGVYQGLVVMVKVIVPNYPNNVRTNVYVVDSDGDDIYAFLDLKKDATHIITDLQIPLISNEVIRVEASGVPGGPENHVVYVTLYYVPDSKFG